jgi:hypothetical protein
VSESILFARNPLPNVSNGTLTSCRTFQLFKMAPQYIFVMPNLNYKKLLFTDEEVRDSFNFHYQMARVNELPNDVRNMIHTLDDLDSSSINQRRLAVNTADNGSGDALAEFNFQKTLEQFANEREFYLEDLSCNNVAPRQSVPSMNSVRMEAEEEERVAILKMGAYTASTSTTEPVSPLCSYPHVLTSNSSHSVRPL